jgi:hypothetical protein
MESHFPHDPHRSHLLSVPSCAISAWFWLVVVYKIVYQQPFKASVYFTIIIFSVVRFDGPNDWTAPPHAPPTARAAEMALLRDISLGVATSEGGGGDDGSDHCQRDTKPWSRVTSFLCALSVMHIVLCCAAGKATLLPFEVKRMHSEWCDSFSF